MKNIHVMFLSLLGAYLIYASCGGSQTKKSTDGGSESIKGVQRTILLAESIENILQKKDLLEQAYNILDKREKEMGKQKRKGIGASQDLDTLFALYYLVKGDYQLAQLYVDKYKGLSKIKPLGIVVESRLVLKKHGLSRAKDVINDLNSVIKKRKKMTIAHLALGDAYYLQLNIKSAKESYKNVLRYGGILQMQAADRLETINKIERTKINPKKFQNLIFANSLRRGEIADILYREYGLHKRIRGGKTGSASYTDIEKSEYGAAIKGLVQAGFFSYIKGTLFEPFKNITRREMVLIIEDYIALTKGQSYRKRYKGDKQSSISNINVSDEAYNAVRLAVQYNIMDLSLSGSIKLDEAISGLEGLLIIQKMIKK